jgi:hypothetical protein
MVADKRDLANFGTIFHGAVFHSSRPALLRAPLPEACDNRYCYYDAVHKDYIYTPAWVDFLAEKLIDQTTYDLVLRGIAPAVA